MRYEGETIIKVSREQLEAKGYNFKYHTHPYTTKANKTYYYCYGYLLLEKEWYLIIQHTD